MLDSITAVNQLAQQIRQILDSANHLTDINMGSSAGRKILADYLARQIVGGARVGEESDEGVENMTFLYSQDIDANLFEDDDLFP